MLDVKVVKFGAPNMLELMQDVCRSKESAVIEFPDGNRMIMFPEGDFSVLHEAFNTADFGQSIVKSLQEYHAGKGRALTMGDLDAI